MLLAVGAHVVLIRRARPSDEAALAQLLDRCSDETRYRRFHCRISEIPAAYLRRCMQGQPSAHEALVAEWVNTRAFGEHRSSRSPHLVGLASTGPTGEAADVYEMCALVEDGWQRRGIGRALATQLCAHASANGVALIRMELCRSQPRLLAYLVAHTSVTAMRSRGCDVSIDIDVGATAIEAPSSNTIEPSDEPGPIVTLTATAAGPKDQASALRWKFSP
jgi:GNAT superfamily N-acetyltransferase